MVLRATLALLVACLGFEAPEGFDLVRAQAAGHAWLLAQKEQWTTWWEQGRSSWSTPVSEGVAGRYTTISMSEMPNGNTAFASNSTILANSEPSPIPNGLFAFVSEPEPSFHSDLVFASVVEEMAAEFTHVATIAPETLPQDNTPIAMNGVEQSDSSEIDSNSTLVPETAIEAATAQFEAEVESRTQRMAIAIRLTGQAMHAWLSLVQVTGSLE